jgi:hypothetical protein
VSPPSDGSPAAGLFGSPPPGDLVAQARAYIAACEWTFAKTMPDNPHWYVIRARAWARGREHGEGHEALFALIRDHHYVRMWHSRPFRSIDLDGWGYWIMEDGTVINRKPVAIAGWDEADLTLF